MSLIRYRRNPALPTTRWFSDLRRDPFHDEFFRRFFGDIGADDRTSVFLPPVDVTEEEGAYQVAAELPGMAREDVDVQVHDGVLTLKAERKQEQEREEGNVHISERRYGTFRRTFQLPETADPAAITAAMKDGVLTVTIPKLEVEEEQPRQIEVQA